MGRFRDGRKAYERALALDAGASYAHSNLTRLPASENSRIGARHEPSPLQWW
jgi:hypothetical protein